MKPRIDTHHHVVPDFYRDWLAEKGIAAGGLPIPRWTAADDLTFMDDAGVQSALLAVSTPGVEPGTREEARAMARRLNEYSAGVVAEHPGRFGFFATLTLPDLDGALAELAYAMDELNADGVVLQAHAGDTYIGDDSVQELIAELDRRGTVVFVHPAELPGPGVPGVPAFLADFLLDTVRAAITLVANGRLERYPDVSFILSHGGGFLPYAASRLAGMLSPQQPGRGVELLRRFYFDTAVTGSPFALPSLLAFADPARITFGTDFPYAPVAGINRFSESLDAYEFDHAAVNRGNAQMLFPRLATAEPASG